MMMNNRLNVTRNATLRELERMINTDEHILWRGIPNKKCFILESIFNPLLPFALLWLTFDSFFIFAITTAENAAEQAPFPILAFFMLHLMPVWIYLFGVFGCFIRHKNTAYIITDKHIYISGGTFTYTTHNVSLSENFLLDIRRSFFDRMIGVGDVIIRKQNDFVTQFGNNRVIRTSVRHSGSAPFTISDISDFEQVYQLIGQQKANHINLSETTK